MPFFNSGAKPALESKPEPELVLGPPCPMCGLNTDPHAAIPGLFTCYLCGLTWNPLTQKARAIRNE